PGVPAPGGQLRDHLVELAGADQAVLQVARPGIGRAAQDHDALVRILEERLERVTAEIGVDGDGIRAIALERLDGVALGGVAYIAALGVQNHGHARMRLVDVLDGALELILGLAAGVTPGMRPAWPSVAGRISASFWRTSCDRPARSV